MCATKAPRELVKTQQLNKAFKRGGNIKRCRQRPGDFLSTRVDFQVPPFSRFHSFLSMPCQRGENR